VEPSCPSLRLSPRWSGDPTILVPATEALRLTRDGGYRELRRDSVCQELASYPRQEMCSARTFVTSARLSSFQLSQFDDAAILSLLGNAIKTGQVVGVQADGHGAGASSDATVEQRRLIASLEAKVRGGLTYQGRRYRLVADVDLARLPSRDSYEVVRHDQGVQVLHGLANEIGQGPAVAPLFVKARSLLTADWRPPFPPDGLILLRKLILVASAPDTSTAITPSQMKALLASQTEATLEIVVLDASDRPFEDVHFTFAAPDDEDHEGELGASGRTQITCAKPGAGVVTLRWQPTP
jgi:hypothetical protein